MALQRIGDADLPRLHALVRAWVDDPDHLVQRAAAAGICEARLLATPESAAVAVEVCRRATEALANRPEAERGEVRTRTLRQGLGYCWSVAADLGPGLAAFAGLDAIADPDVGWVVRENRKNKRLAALLA